MLNPFRSTPPQDDSPGALASELAAARSTCDEQVRQARQALSQARTNVIDRGVARMEAVTQMIAELADEQTQLDRIINRTSEIERGGPLVVQPTAAESVVFEDTGIEPKG